MASIRARVGPSTLHAERRPGDFKREEMPPIDGRKAQALADGAAEIASAYGYARKAPTSKPKDKSNGPDHDSATTDWTIDFIDHDKLASVAMKLLRSGANDGAVVNFFRANVEALTNIDEDRRQRRLKEIPGIVSSARARGSTPTLLALPSRRTPVAPNRRPIARRPSETRWRRNGSRSPWERIWSRNRSLGCGRGGSRTASCISSPAVQDRLKTTTAMDFAATVTVGGQWPDGSPASAGNVLIWSGEDAIDDTLLPRFMAAGGDRTRVVIHQRGRGGRQNAQLRSGARHGRPHRRLRRNRRG